MIQKAGLSPNQSNFHHWLDEISQQTHQWPVHIASYGMELVEYIEKQGKTLNEEGLQIVLENGLKAKETYYDHRTRVWPKEVCESFASFLSQTKQTLFSHASLIHHFEKSFDKEKAQALLNQGLHFGMIHETKQRDYSVPVPSMQSWFLREYLPEKEKRKTLFENKKEF